MANIKLKNILKDAFPLDRCGMINDYYHVMGRKTSEKYITKWDKIFESKWNIVTELGLDQINLPRQFILDIGAGPHIFAWLAVRLGHHVTTTELPLDNPYVPADNIQWFKDIKTALYLNDAIKTIPYIINDSTSQLPQEVQKNWDIITIQRSNFDIGWNKHDYELWLPYVVETCNTLLYEIAREQYQPCVEYLETTQWTWKGHIGKKRGQGLIVIQ